MDAGRDEDIPTSGLRKTEMCKFHLANRCRAGAKCAFAHDPSEIREKPNLEKTEMCRSQSFVRTGQCDVPRCGFAHSEDELRQSAGFIRTKLCRFGPSCQTAGCRFAHNIEELGTRRDPAPAAGGEEATGAAAASAAAAEEEPAGSAGAAGQAPTPKPSRRQRYKWYPAPGGSGQDGPRPAGAEVYRSASNKAPAFGDYGAEAGRSQSSRPHRDIATRQRVASNDGSVRTLLICNIPTFLTQTSLLALLQDLTACVRGHCDFFYCPWDDIGEGNLGYAILNFTSAALAAEFKEQWANKSLLGAERLRIVPATLQGREANVKHFSAFPMARGADKRFSPLARFGPEGVMQPIVLSEEEFAGGGFAGAGDWSGSLLEELSRPTLAVDAVPPGIAEEFLAAVAREAGRAPTIVDSEDLAIFCHLFAQAWDANEVSVVASVRQVAADDDGGRVLMVDTVECGFSVRSVLKLGPAPDIQREAAGTQLASRYVPTLPIMAGKVYGSRRGLRLRFPQSGVEEGLVSTLADLFRAGDDEAPEQMLEDAVSALASQMARGIKWTYVPEDPYAMRKPPFAADPSGAAMPQGDESRTFVDIDFGQHMPLVYGQLAELYSQPALEREVLFFCGLCFPSPVQLFYIGLLNGPGCVKLQAELARRGTAWARVHRDLHAENVLVEALAGAVGAARVMGFASFGPGHAAEDLTRLESSILLFCTAVDIEGEKQWFAEGLRLAGDLATESVTLQHGDDSAMQSLSSPSLRRAGRLIRHLRSRAVAQIGPLSTTEHRLSLLRWCMLTVGRRTPSPAHAHLAVAYAGFLAQHIVMEVESHAAPRHSAGLPSWMH